MLKMLANRMKALALLLLCVLITSCAAPGEGDISVAPSAEAPPSASPKVVPTPTATPSVEPSPDASESAEPSPDATPLSPQSRAVAAVYDYAVTLKDIDGVTYVRVADVADALGFTFGTTEEANYYVRDPEDEVWQWMTVSAEVEYGTSRADSEAEYINIDNRGFSYMLWRDDPVATLAYMHYIPTVLRHPMRIVGDDAWVSLDDATRLFDAKLTFNMDKSTMTALPIEVLFDELEAIAAAQGYSLNRDIKSVTHGVAAVQKDEIYYLMREDGMLLADQGFTQVYFAVSEDFIVGGADGLWGVLDVSGEYEIERKFVGLHIYDYLPFYVAQLRDGDRTLSGFYDYDGNEVIPPIYEYLGAIGFVEQYDGFHDETHFPLFDGTRLGARLDGLWGMLDLEGNVVLPFEYDMIGQVLADDYSASYRVYTDETCTAVIVVKDGRYGGVNADGELVVPFGDTPF